MPLRDLTAKKIRRTSEFSPAERQLLNRYKSEYRNEADEAARGRIFKEKVLVDFFNLLDSENRAPEGDAAIALAKRIGKFIHNNWRPRVSVRKEKPSLNVRVFDVVRETMPERVNEELKALLEKGPLGDEGKPEFALKNCAVRRVLDALTPAELAEVKRTKAEWAERGRPENTQRQRADRFAVKKLRENGATMWKDMGMLGIYIGVWKAVDGEEFIFMEDSIKTHLGEPRASNFSTTHPALVRELKAKLLEYIAAVRGEAAGAEDSAGAAPGPLRVERPDLEVKLTEEGFPIVPPLPEPGALQREQFKKEIEPVLREYLNHHYYLASGRTRRHVPYEAVEANRGLFIESQYIPPEMPFKDPRNMRLQDLQELLRHFRQRQKDNGPAGAFRWSRYIQETTNGEKTYVPAIYGSRLDLTRRETKAARRQANAKIAKANGARRTAPAGVSALTGLIPLSPRVSPTPPPQRAVANTAAPAAATGTTPSGARHPAWLDPALMGTPGVQTVATRIVPTPMSTPRVSVTHAQMHNLVAWGHVSVAPCNGPDDGSPRYLITAGAVEAAQGEAYTPSGLPETPIRSSQPESSVAAATRGRGAGKSGWCAAKRAAAANGVDGPPTKRQRQTPRSKAEALLLNEANAFMGKASRTRGKRGKK
ncbi:hypothetical protein NLJ89_g11237 [Agrocybe chaxingu]|uniref:Uncharacterized protein n=1 Tax=Agrocybe chaxingu TaxID=84603 RepID=A0A9W8JP38_9AGAR|nr:hypothetical protein NLJ89_g11237 [Agrocybe chaxingu]